MHTDFTNCSNMLSVVVPALNEEKYVGKVVRKLLESSYVDEIVVVDNGSEDSTAEQAKENGAKVVLETTKGFGSAMLCGINAARNEWIFKADADMRNPEAEWINKLVKKTSEDHLFVKGYWSSEEDPMPVTNLVAKPSIKKFFPGLTHILMPLSGIYLFHKSLFDFTILPKNWSFDLALMINAAKRGHCIEQAFLGTVIDTYKPVANYIDMSYQIIDYLSSLVKTSQVKKHLFVLSSVEDLLVWCSGTILKLISIGHTVKVIFPLQLSLEVKESRTLEQLKNIKYEFLNQKLDSLDVSDQATGKLYKLIDDFQPDTLTTNHFDAPGIYQRKLHSLVTSVCNRLNDSAKPKSIYMCQSYLGYLAVKNRFEPNAFNDISNYAKLKYDIIKTQCDDRHQAQLKIASAADDFNGLKSGSEKAESFEIYIHKFI